MTIPHNPVVKAALGWLLSAACLSLVVASISPTNLSEAVGAFFMNMVVPYFCGAFASGSVVIRLAALAAAGVFAGSILVDRFQSRGLAQVGLGALMVLSLFCLWFDSYLTVAANPLLSTATAEVVAQSTITSLIDIVGGSANFVISGLWVAAWYAIAREADAELEETQTRRQLTEEVETLLQEVPLPTAPSRPTLKNNSLQEVACDACRVVGPATNRFCSRCGAPLRKVPVPL